MRKQEQEKGFSLTEVMIAVLLLAIAFTGGISMYFQADRFVGTLAHKRVALDMANALMEEARAIGYLNTLPPAAVKTLIQTEALYIEGLRAERHVWVLDVDNPPGGTYDVDYKEVTVDVTWKEAGESNLRKVVVTTYIAR